MLKHVGILTFNNEKTIERAIRPFVEKKIGITCLDSGSTDKTKKILEKYNVNVIETEWIDDFSMMRNKLIRAINSDWIIMLDSDEYMSDKDVDILLNDINKCSHDIDIIVGKVINQYNGKEYIEPYKERAFRNNKKIKYVRRIHERLESVGDIKYYESKFKIYHTGYNISPKEKKEKIIRNLRILENYKEEQIDIFFWSREILNFNSYMMNFNMLEKEILNPYEKDLLYQNQMLSIYLIKAIKEKEEWRIVNIWRKFTVSYPIIAINNFIIISRYINEEDKVILKKQKEEFKNKLENEDYDLLGNPVSWLND